MEDYLIQTQSSLPQILEICFVEIESRCESSTIYDNFADDDMNVMDLRFAIEEGNHDYCFVLESIGFSL